MNEFQTDFIIIITLTCAATVLITAATEMFIQKKLREVFVCLILATVVWAVQVNMATKFNLFLASLVQKSQDKQ